MSVDLDDIDDLLAEVESAIAGNDDILSTISTSTPGKHGISSVTPPSDYNIRSKLSLGRCEDNGSYPSSNIQIFPRNVGHSERAFEVGGVTKCSPVYISIASHFVQYGLSPSPCKSSGSMVRKSCDHLRCTACDFEVMKFDHKIWNTENSDSISSGDDCIVDYMFFRNFFPNRERLDTRTHIFQNAASYCCQCSWISLFPNDVLFPPSNVAGLFNIRHRGGTPVIVSELSLKQGLFGGEGWKYWACGGHHNIA